jgi:hypothetical protein
MREFVYVSAGRFHNWFLFITHVSLCFFLFILLLFLLSGLSALVANSLTLCEPDSQTRLRLKFFFSFGYYLQKKCAPVLVVVFLLVSTLKKSTPPACRCFLKLKINCTQPR